MRQLAVPGAITGLLALAGFIVAHSVLIPWANPRFLFGAAFQGAVPALIGGMAAAWLYQRSAQRISPFPASGALFGLALWLPIVPIELVALAFGAQRADAGGLVVILSLLAPTLIVALGAWRYLGGWRGATGAALAVLPGVMFIGGGAVDAGGSRHDRDAVREHSLHLCSLWGGGQRARPWFAASGDRPPAGLKGSPSSPFEGNEPSAHPGNTLLRPGVRRPPCLPSRSIARSEGLMVS